MALQGVTQLRYDVDYSQVTKAVAACSQLFNTIASLSKKSADEISKSFIDAQGKLALASKAASDAVTKVRQKQESDAKAIVEKSTQDEIAARERVKVAAFAAFAQRRALIEEEKRKEKELADLKAKHASEYQAIISRVDDTRKKGLNAVRDSIFKIEEEIRTLRLKNILELDVAEKKANDTKIKLLNAELQLHRSSEKTQVGRTFTEQLEKNFSGPIIGQMAMMKGMFGQMRESMSAPVSGSGVVGTIGAFASKAVPFVAAGVAVGAALKGVVDVGMEFQDALADLSAITGVTGPKLDSLGDKARILAMKYGIDAKDGVGAFKLALSALGPAVAQDEASLNSMGQSIMTLAKASGVDAQTATLALTNTINQFGYSTASSAVQAEQMRRVMNVMAAGSKEGAAEVADLSMSMKEVGTVANLAGVSIEATVGSLEILSQNGIKGAEAGTGLRNVLLSLSAGTEQSQEVLSKLGLTFNDINPKTVGYEKSLATVRNAMDNMKNPTDKAIILKKLFGKENAATANILLQSTKTVDGHTSALHNMTKAVTGTNTANEQAKTKMATISETWARISSTVEDVAISIFEALQPAIQWVLEGFEGFIEVGKDVWKVATDVAKAIGPVLSFMFEGLKTTVEVAIFPLKILWNVFKGIGEFLINTLSPAFNWFKDKVLLPIGNAINSVGTAIMGAWEKVKAWVADAVKWIEEKWRDAKVFINDISFGLIGESEEDMAAEDAVNRTKAVLEAKLAAAKKLREDAIKNSTVISSSTDPVGGPTAPASDSLLSGGSGDKAKKPLEILKDQYQAQEAIANQAFERRKAITERQFAEGTLTEQGYRDQKIADERAHLNRIVKLEEEFGPKFLALDKSEGEVRALEKEKANTRLAQLSKEARLNSVKDASDAMDREIVALRENQNEASNAIEDAHERGVLTRRKYLEILHKTALDSMDAEIATLKEYAEQYKGVDDDKYNATIKAMVKADGQRRGMAAQFAKTELEEKKKYQKDIDDRTLATMNEGIDKKLRAEELRYKRELEMAELTADQKLLIEKEHAKNILDITKEGEKEKAKDVSKYTDIVSGFFQKGYNDRSKYLHESIATDILGQEKGYFKQRGLLKRFLVDQLKTFLTNKVAEVLIHSTTETSKTAATQTGTLARIASTVGEVASSLWAAAASAFNAAAQGIRWVFTTIPFPFNLIAAAAIPPAVYGLYRGAKSLFKFASGGYVSGPGGPKDDAIPAYLSNKEYVLSAETTERLGGKENLDKINFGKQPVVIFGNQNKQFAAGGYVQRFAEGGLVDLDPRSQSIRMGAFINSIWNKLKDLFSGGFTGSVIQNIPNLAIQMSGSSSNQNFLLEKFDKLIYAVENQQPVLAIDQRENIISQNKWQTNNKKRRLTG